MEGKVLASGLEVARAWPLLGIGLLILANMNENKAGVEFSGYAG